MYADDDMLMLSGIQHFRFCPRQWALIHIEQEWRDNRLTIEGQIQHHHVDNPFYRQKCGDNIVLRAVNIASNQLGLYGVADLIELVPADGPADAITHPKYQGWWHPVPIEYKHGHPKRNEIDEVQLAAQAMCLEELYGINIPSGAFFYAEIRRRVDVIITSQLRDIVHMCSHEMHQIFAQGVIPQGYYSPKCDKCSLHEICMPHASSGRSVSDYLQNNLYK